MHGDTSVLWGALGKLEGIVKSGDDEARWALLDRLGSVVAEATGAEGTDISELVSYAEHGEPSFESVGYQNPYGFTGQPQDGGTGRVSFGSRDYDPQTASWFAPDEWPGLLVAPQSLNRYAYVLGNPVTFADLGGFRPYEPGYSVTKNGSGWQYQKQAPKTVLNHSALANHYGRQVASGWNAGNTRSYAMVGPSGQTQFMSARHATATRQVTGESCSKGSTNRYVIQGCTGSSVSSNTFVDAGKEFQEWARSDAGSATSSWLAFAAIALPVAGVTARHPYAIGAGLILGYVAGLASTVIDCTAAIASPKCVIGAIGAGTGPFGGILTRLPKHATLVGVVTKNTLSIVGYQTTALNWLITFGEWYEGDTW
ncbi:MAG: RHS repeat-associated core domain-containing protein [Aquabacterium sp.]|nr:MAG: RHS repeat-associated core domain-containing protein [Aquabacterium sp.]